jgi:hypothetical protein
MSTLTKNASSSANAVKETRWAFCPKCPTPTTVRRVVHRIPNGSGKAPTYNLTGDTEITPVTRQGSRIAFKLPFGDPSAAFRPEGIEGEDPYGKDDVVTLHIESSDRDDPKKARGLLGVRHEETGEIVKGPIDSATWARIETFARFAIGHAGNRRIAASDTLQFFRPQAVRASTAFFRFSGCLQVASRRGA